MEVNCEANDDAREPEIENLDVEEVFEANEQAFDPQNEIIGTSEEFEGYNEVAINYKKKKVKNKKRPH
ncbi:hypothetical protein OROHE_009572 [Orobanche hederae]